MPGSLPEMLERIALGSVAVTATSLLEAGSGELTFIQWRALVVIGGVPGSGSARSGTGSGPANRRARGWWPGWRGAA